MQDEEAPVLERILGVAQVRLDGVNPREARINLRVNDLEAHRVDVRDVLRLVRDSNFDQNLGVIRRAPKRYLIFFEYLTPIVWTSVADIGVTLTLRYLCEPRKRRSSAGAVWEEILAAFGECDDVDFAYPTQRFYDNAREGKPGARAPEA